MSRPVHFEIPADDPARARQFYRDVFGWKIEDEHGPVEYFLVETGDEGPGINGAILRRDAPVESLVNIIGVGSLDETVRAVEASGGRVIESRKAIQGVGWHAYCADTEGNVFGVLEPDENAS